jgi:Skp family chaperone for outer membrane proteins
MTEKDLGNSIEAFEEELEALKHTRMKIFGITVTPTTIGAAFAIVSAALGSLYGAFQVYTDYTDMREIVQSIDVSVIETRNAQIETALENVKTEVSVQLAAIQKQLDDSEKRARETKVDTVDRINNLDEQVRRVEKLVRDTENEVRQIVQNAEERFDNKRDALQNQYDTKASELRDTTDRKIADVESRLNSKLQRALDNPLAN